MRQSTYDEMVDRMRVFSNCSSSLLIVSAKGERTKNSTTQGATSKQSARRGTTKGRCQNGSTSAVFGQIQRRFLQSRFSATRVEGPTTHIEQIGFHCLGLCSDSRCGADPHDGGQRGARSAGRGRRTWARRIRPPRGILAHLAQPRVDFVSRTESPSSHSCNAASSFEPTRDSNASLFSTPSPRSACRASANSVRTHDDLAAISPTCLWRTLGSRDSHFLRRHLLKELCERDLEQNALHQDRRHGCAQGHF